MRIFRDSFDLQAILERTRVAGYAFASNAVTDELNAALAEEIRRQRLEVGDHVNYPINKGAANEVRQMHERAYHPLDHADVPVGTELCRALSALTQPMLHAYPELEPWLLNEIGYQQYRDDRDWISPHRDRATDRLLSVTFTMFGSAWIRLYAPETDPPDYRHLRQTDQFLTGPGTVLFLRAPGFGSGQQIIHEVMPPVVAPRGILNLRMRPTILKPPSET